MQQIIVSGIGGQGVLFVTRLLAETALDRGYSVFISETHGMAQRGGNVISHLKVSRCEAHGGCPPESTFHSPLIRPGRADILLALHPDAYRVHGYYLKPDGIAYVNSPSENGPFILDAGKIAEELETPVASNLVLLGFAIGFDEFFCSRSDVEKVLAKFAGSRLELSLKAFRAGCAGSGTRKHVPLSP